MIDQERLEAWLAQRASWQATALGAAIYEGLLARVRRGEFDEEAGR